MRDVVEKLTFDLQVDSQGAERRVIRYSNIVRIEQLRDLIGFFDSQDVYIFTTCFFVEESVFFFGFLASL